MATPAPAGTAARSWAPSFCELRLASTTPSVAIASWPAIPRAWTATATATSSMPISTTPRRPASPHPMAVAMPRTRRASLQPLEHHPVALQDFGGGGGQGDLGLVLIHGRAQHAGDRKSTRLN